MGNCEIEKLGKYKSTFECLLQFNIHVLKLLHLGLGKCCQNCITTLAYPSKKAAKLITNQNYTAHANPLFSKLKLLSINDIHKLEVAKYMFKTIQLHSGTTPSLVTPLSSLHNYYTKNSTTNFFIKRSNSELDKKSKQILGARVWLEVPDHIKDLLFQCLSKNIKNI